MDKKKHVQQLEDNTFTISWEYKKLDVQLGLQTLQRKSGGREIFNWLGHFPGFAIFMGSFSWFGDILGSFSELGDFRLTFWRRWSFTNGAVPPRMFMSTYTLIGNHSVFEFRTANCAAFMLEKPMVQTIKPLLSVFKQTARNVQKPVKRPTGHTTTSKGKISKRESINNVNTKRERESSWSILNHICLSKNFILNIREYTNN